MTTAAMPVPADARALEGLQLPMSGLDPLGGLMMMNGPSMNTLKKSQSHTDCKHPCVYQYGSCSFGDECKFAEIDGKVCAKFLKGGCSWGNNCCWKHTTTHKIPGKGDRHHRNMMPRRPMDDMLHNELYDGLAGKQQMGHGYDNMHLSRDPIQQLQLQQHLSGLSGHPAPMAGHNDLLPGMQGYSGLEEGGMNGFNDGGMQFQGFNSLEGDMPEIRDVTGFIHTIQDRVKQFEDSYTKRMGELQVELARAEKERNDEVERNRRSVSALMTSVEKLTAKLRDSGIPLQGEAAHGPIGSGSFEMSRPLPPAPAAPAAAAAAASPVDEATAKRVCQHCGKAGRLLLCGRCKSATFCNTECQREAWTMHSKVCIPAKPE